MDPASAAGSAQLQVHVCSCRTFAVRIYIMSPLQEDTGALISAAAAAAAQQQQEQAAGQQPQQQQQPELPHMGATFQRTAAAWQEDQDSEETEGGLPEGVVLVRLLPLLGF